MSSLIPTRRPEDEANAHPLSCLQRRHVELTSLWDLSVVKGQRLSGDHVIPKHGVCSARINNVLNPH